MKSTAFGLLAASFAIVGAGPAYAVYLSGAPTQTPEWAQAVVQVEAIVQGVRTRSTGTFIEEVVNGTRVGTILASGHGLTDWYADRGIFLADQVRVTFPGGFSFSAGASSLAILPSYLNNPGPEVANDGRADIATIRLPGLPTSLRGLSLIDDPSPGFRNFGFQFGGYGRSGACDNPTSGSLVFGTNRVSGVVNRGSELSGVSGYFPGRNFRDGVGPGDSGAGLVNAGDRVFAVIKAGDVNCIATGGTFTYTLLRAEEQAWIRGNMAPIRDELDPQAVPEPSTMIGSLVALGFGVLFKRR